MAEPLKRQSSVISFLKEQNFFIALQAARGQFLKKFQIIKT